MDYYSNIALILITCFDNQFNVTSQHTVKEHKEEEELKSKARFAPTDHDSAVVEGLGKISKRGQDHP